MGQLEHTASRLGRPFVLITHNSDYGFDPSLINRVESLPNLVHWYGQNLREGGRRTTLPIGLENLHHGRIKPGYYTRTRGVKKEHLAVATFRPRNDERRSLIARLKRDEWVREKRSLFAIPSAPSLRMASTHHHILCNPYAGSHPRARVQESRSGPTHARGVATNSGLIQVRNFPPRQWHRLPPHVGDDPRRGRASYAP